MGFFEKLHPASFKGVSFSVPSESESGGKKIAEHNYPGSDIRNNEELGTLPPSFSLDVIIHGENVDDRRRALIRVLNSPGNGTLVHPVYGSIDVLATSYSASSDDGNVGIVRMSIEFSTSDPAASLNPTGTLANGVSAAAADSRTQAGNIFSFNYNEPATNNQSQNAATKTDSIYDQVFERISSVVNPVQDGISDFTRVVNENRRRVFSIVRKAQSLKDSLMSLYDTALTVVNTPADLLREWQDLIDFGFDEPAGKTNTVDRALIEENRITLNDHTRVNALINTMESAAHSDFQTDTELDETRQVIEDGFRTIVDEGDPSSIVFNVELRASLNDLRNKTREVLDQKENTVWRIDSFKTANTSMSLITYDLYGSIDRLEVVQNLNSRQNFAHINNETLRVVS